MAKFHRHPHETNIVRHEGEVHPEHHDLVHGVVELQVRRRQAACLQLVRDVGGAEHARGEADERVQDDEYRVEIVDEQVLPRRWPIRDEK